MLTLCSQGHSQFQCLCTSTCQALLLGASVTCYEFLQQDVQLLIFDRLGLKREDCTVIILPAQYPRY